MVSKKLDLYIFENLGKPHTAQSFRGGILDSGSCIAKYGTYVKIFMVEEAQTKHQSPLPPVHQPPLLEVEQDSFGTSVYNIPSSVPGGSQKSKWKNLVEQSEKDNYFSFCLSLAMLLFLLEKTQGLLAHNQVGVWVVTVVVLHNQEVDTHMKVKSLWKVRKSE